jgi:peroxiredoxin
LPKKCVYLLIAAILSILITGCSGNQPPVTPEKGTITVGAQPGQRAPDFILPNNNNDSITLGQMRGNVVVVNFFATWCGPCREEMRDLEHFYRKKDVDVVFLGINIKEDKDVVTQFASSGGFTFPMLRDSVGQVAEKYQIRAIPTTFIIDKQGFVRDKKVGPVTVVQLMQMVEAARK